jgi:GAF domain-containing protein
LRALEPQWAEELLASSNLQLGLADALEHGLNLSNTTLGNIQVVDWQKRHLTIAAQRGFGAEFLKFFEYVAFSDGSACARAIRSRSQVVVGDVTSDRQYATCREIALRSGYRAVQSTPLISPSGAFVGMLSTHFQTPRLPSPIELNALLEFGQKLAGKIILYRVRSRNPSGAGDLTSTISRARESINESHDRLRRLDVFSVTGNSS